MKSRRVAAYKAKPTDKEVQGVVIQIEDEIPQEIKTLEETGAVLANDAEAIACALIDVLPQATLIRLTSRLLHYQATKTFFVVGSE